MPRVILKQLYPLGERVVPVLLHGPVNYYAQGQLKAVLGGWSPSARKYLKYDELTFSVSGELFKLMLDRWPKSFLKLHAWHTIKNQYNVPIKSGGKGNLFKNSMSDTQVNVKWP